MNARSLWSTLLAAKEAPCIHQEKLKEKQIPIDGGVTPYQMP